MKSRTAFGRSALYVAMSAMVIPPQAFAAPLELSTAPAGTAYKPAVPNVIVTLDDSGSMHGDAMDTLKKALNATFTPQNVPDGSIRMGWNAMNRCTSIPSIDGGCENQNGLRILDSTQRSRFLDWVNRNEKTEPKGLYAQGVTPTHAAYIAAAEHYRIASSAVDGPWASVPGATSEPVLSCRKSYSLLMTDGGWNHSAIGPAVTRRGGNADGTATTLPDGTTYDPASPASRIYGDAWGGSQVTAGKTSGSLSSMADLAFHYWSTNLTGLPMDVAPRIRRSGAETFTSGSASVTLPEYWNPKNDPATWQHMTTYTIGFRDAATWPTTGVYASYPVWAGDTYSGSFSDLVTGVKTWPDPIGPGPVLGGLLAQSRKTELWHMAINSRGKFIPAITSDDLVNAFSDILNEIVADGGRPVTSLAVTSRSARTDSAVFAAGYGAADWSGEISAFKVNKGTGSIDADGLWGTATAPPRPHSTATLMDAQSASWPSDRLVLSAKTDGTAQVATGIPWRWASLSTAQQTQLKTVGGTLDTTSTADKTAQQRMAYLRGDRTLEQNQTPSGPFRTRGSRHGDIVNSKLWFLEGKPGAGYRAPRYAEFRAQLANRPSMVYVGANDGMLHGFDAATGQERIAYVPEGLHAKLPELTRPKYNHRYFVDGSPLTGDLDANGAWKTYLAGFLGAGGKGYFVLDVTAPAQFTENNAESIVVLDKTGATTMDADMGHITGTPAMERSDPTISRQIARLNNGRWALVLGNGANSTSEKAVLLIQYLDGLKELVKISADGTGNNGNGLSTPRLIDLSGDQIPDVAYAGDLRGNLWKFDLSSPDADKWKVAFDGAPLHVAQDASTPAKPQAITGAPIWLAHPDGGVMIVYGTGRNLTDADRRDANVQSVYGVHDSTPVTLSDTASTATGTKPAKFGAGTPISTGRDELVRQTVSAAATGATTDSNSSLWTLSANPVDYQGRPRKKGWYLDLPESGERVLDNLGWFQGDLVDFSSVVPALGNPNPDQELCEPPTANGKSYLTTLNAIDGARPESTIYGYNAIVGSATGSPSRVATGLRIGLRNGGTEIGVGGQGGNTPGRIYTTKFTRHPSWRQLQ